MTAARRCDARFYNYPCFTGKSTWRASSVCARKKIWSVNDRPLDFAPQPLLGARSRLGPAALDAPARPPHTDRAPFKRPRVLIRVSPLLATLCFGLVGIALTGCDAEPTPISPTSAGSLEVTVSPFAINGPLTIGGLGDGGVPDKATYIVQLFAGVNSGDVVKTTGHESNFRYSHVFNGFSIELPAAAALALTKNTKVKHIALAGVGKVNAQIVPVGFPLIGAPYNTSPARVVNEPIMFFDTGVKYQPNEVNLVSAHNCLRQKGKWTCTNSGLTGSTDEHGHGTFTSAVAAADDDTGGTVGTAPFAPIHSFKICDGTGTCYTDTAVAATCLLARPSGWAHTAIGAANAASTRTRAR